MDVMDKRMDDGFKGLDKRIDEGLSRVNKRIDDTHHFLYLLLMLFACIIFLRLGRGEIRQPNVSKSSKKMVGASTIGGESVRHS